MSVRRPSDAVREHRAAMIAAAQRHRAGNVRIFGSVASGTDSAGSDIDVVVTFSAGASLLDLVELEDELREITGFPVDVVSDRAQRVALVAADARPL